MRKPMPLRWIEEAEARQVLAMAQSEAPPPYRPSGVYKEDDNYRRYDDQAPLVSPTPRPPEDSRREW